RLARTNMALNVNSKLGTLIQQLATTKAERTQGIAMRTYDTVTSWLGGTQGFANGIRDEVNNIANSDFFGRSPYKIMQIPGKITSIIAQNGIDAIPGEMVKAHNQFRPNTLLNTSMELINELATPTGIKQKL